MPFVAPVPFLFLELMVGLVQATVFSTLVLVYLTTASQRHDPMPVPGAAH
jgi:F0F1-type ATP synthase membrane subunit a